jgi:hypothetical protein
VNRQLSKGVITSSDPSGPLAGKTVTDLANLMKKIQYTLLFEHKLIENGEIQRVIAPSNTGYTQGL